MRNHINAQMTHKKQKGHPLRESSKKTAQFKDRSERAKSHLKDKYTRMNSSDDVVQTPYIYDLVRQGLAVVKPKSLLDRLLWESNKSYVLHDGGDRREYHSYPVAKTTTQKVIGLFNNKYRPEWTIEYKNGGGSSSGGGSRR